MPRLASGTGRQVMEAAWSRSRFGPALVTPAAMVGTKQPAMSARMVRPIMDTPSRMPETHATTAVRDGADALALGDMTIEELAGDVYVHGRVRH